MSCHTERHIFDRIILMQEINPAAVLYRRKMWESLSCDASSPRINEKVGQSVYILLNVVVRCTEKRKDINVF